MARSTQPYRATPARRQSSALNAMTRGRAAFMRHPLDTKRKLQRKRRKPRKKARAPHAQTLALRRAVSQPRRSVR